MVTTASPNTCFASAHSALSARVAHVASDRCTPPHLSDSNLNVMGLDTSTPKGDAMARALDRARAIFENGNRYHLNRVAIEMARHDVRQAVVQHARPLAAPGAAQAVQDTLTQTLHDSPTFRRTVAYGLNNQTGKLRDLIFCDMYDTQAQPGQADILHQVIYVSPPPPADTPDMQRWQAELVHLVLRVITGAWKPDCDVVDRDAARVLSIAVAHEMDWRLPEHLAAWNPALPIDPPQYRPAAASFEAHPTRPSVPPTVAHAANEIRRLGAWNDQHGDLVPALIPHLARGLALRIECEGMPPQIFADETVPAHLRKTVTLTLLDNHYVAGTRDDIRFNPDRDGNCFYSSLGYGLYGSVPNLRDIQAMRNIIAGFLEDEATRFGHFLADAEPEPSLVTHL